MSSKSFDIDICKGCESLWEDKNKTRGVSRALNCNMAPEYDKRRCPCLGCLIKTMCKIECADFVKYRTDMPLEYFRVKKE